MPKKNGAVAEMQWCSKTKKKDINILSYIHRTTFINIQNNPPVKKIQKFKYEHNSYKVDDVWASIKQNGADKIFVQERNCKYTRNATLQNCHAKGF